MTGYSSTSDIKRTIEEDGWVLADSGTVKNEAVAAMLSLDMALAYPRLPQDPSKLDAVISVLAPTTSGAERAPLRLVAVLDKSGSMQGEKLRLVIETVKFMLQHLTDRDALGLVTFDTQVQVLAPLTSCSSEGRTHLKSVIERVTSGSQTNLSGGLLRGLELHKEAVRSTMIPSVALQRVYFGNTYRRLSEPVEAPERNPPPAGAERVHEWTMELHTDTVADAALIQKVVYKLHPTFRTTSIEVFETPFKLTKVGWGLFKVHAEVHLHDGRIIPLEHELCFNKPEQFRTVLLPLQNAPLELAGQSEPEDDQSVVRSTFLFTDGAANVGIRDSEPLCDAVAAMCAELGSKRCTISTFGFGVDHCAEPLRDIAKVGNGVYCFIENADSIGEAFGEALGGLLSVTHQNVRLCLELAPNVQLAKARTSYPVDGPTLGESGWQTFGIDVGDLFAEERRDILLEFLLPQAHSEGSETIARFHARGFSVLSSSSQSTDSRDLSVERSSSARDECGSVHPQVERHRNRYIASEALDSARAAARRGNLEEARHILQNASSELAISSIAVQGCPLTAALLSNVQECLTDLRNQHTYTTTGSKKMAYMQMAHERQRTCGATTSSIYCVNMEQNSLKFEGSSIRTI